MSSRAGERRVALVTGGRRGIGRAICYQLAEAGFDLLLNDVVVDEALDETVSGVHDRGAEIECFSCDIADLQSHAALVDAAYSRFGRLDALINNAGVQVRRRGDLLAVSLEHFDAVLNTNLRGTFFLTRSVAAKMLEDGAPTLGRSIVIISSSNAKLASIEKGEYCISKSGLSMVAKLFALRLAEAGIGVFEIRPGLINTDMTAEVRARYGDLIDQGISPIRRWGKPEDVARTIVTLVLGNIPFATGAAFDVDGGLMIPRL